MDSLFRCYYYSKNNENTKTQKMELFHIIIISVAVFLLIITLAIVGIMMNSKKTSVKTAGIFPALANNCPDFWLSADKNVCIVPEENRNKGRWTPDIVNQAPRTFGYSIPNATIDFADAGWSSTGKSSICAKNAWANTYNIAWDGVSNYTGCNA